MNRTCFAQTKKSYRAAGQIFAFYWNSYGGLTALVSSPYFHAALVLTAVCYPLWISGEWWDFALEFLPSAMGFSLAAFAMILAFGNDTFITVLATKAKRRDKAAFERTSNAFFHFLVVQFLALVVAIGCKSLFIAPEPWLVWILSKIHVSADVYVQITRIAWPIGFLLLSYSVMCGLTASVRIYRLANAFVKVMNYPKEAKTADSDKAQSAI